MPDLIMARRDSLLPVCWIAGWCVVWTPRGEAHRIISMRNANEHEIKKTWIDPDDAPELTDDFFE